VELLKPKALVLDFGGVVIKTPFEILRALEARLGIAPNVLDWHGPYAPERDALWARMQRDEITERDYWELRAQETGRAMMPPRAMSTRELMLEMYSLPEDVFMRPEAIETIAASHAAGMPVAVLTNDLAAFHGGAWYGKLAISKCIDHLVDGSVTNVLKPDPGAYALVLETLGLEPQDALFVDDQRRNVDGAARIGMRTAWFDVTEPNASFAAVRRILAGDVRLHVAK
jgi:putative hydrolase of the HAD superfamily